MMPTSVPGSALSGMGLFRDFRNITGALSLTSVISIITFAFEAEPEPSFAWICIS
uniref:Uncharacterized protein n=1 Tax=Anguilla anguilla TaxID=7936 RepID=A0A0E9XDV2_ANGAN